MTNTDGSQLTDLGFYRLYYAVSPGAPCPGATFIQVASPTTTPGGETISARIRGLTTGTSYTAAVTAVDVNGSESPCSGTAGAVAGSDFSVTPTTSVNFGSVDIGSVAEQVFVVQNTRDGTVNGTVSVAAPFSVVSGSSFTLVGNGATQNVRVRFTPTSAVLSTTNVSFSADGDVVTRTMTGIGVGTAPPPTFALTVSKTGAGGGTVTSNPAGISCGASCSASFNSGTTVTLTAAPAAGSTFTGWSGSGCTGMGSCTVTMTASRAVTASFGGQSFALTVNKSGPGTGTVSSAPAGISCGATCSASFSSGTTVTLTAAPNTGSTFTGWSGSSCTGTGTCTVTMTAARSVTAAFGAQALSLTVSPTTGPVGTQFTATLSNWTGAGWIALAPAGSPDSAFGAWAYVSSLATVGNTKTWSVTPPTAGSYEIRLYSDGFTRAGTSPAFTVSAAGPPQGNASIVVSPATGPAGTQFTATVSNWTGGGWIALAPAGSPDSAYGAWAYVSSLPGAGTKTWNVTPPTAGSYEIRLYSDGFTRAGTSPAFTVSAAGGPPPGGATVGVSPTTGLTGAQFTVTVTNWTGGGWIALAPAGSPDSAYGQWTYVSSLPGAGTKTWNVIPPTAGSYEARLYSNGFTRAGTAAFTVADPVPTLAVSPTSGAAGTPFTVTLTDWMGAGWIALAPAGSADGAYLAWAYVSSLATVGNTKTWSVTPPTPGTYEIRLYSNGFTRAATSSPFTGF